MLILFTHEKVHKILTSAETIDNIIAATPGMSADHVAVCEYFKSISCSL